MFLCVLRHIEAYQCILRAEHLFSQTLCQMGLAYSCRTEEEKRPDRSARVSQSEPGTSYSFHHLVDGFVLADDA